MAEAVDLELELAAKELEDSKKQYHHDEYELVAYGRYCPEELVNQLTPMEFEEIVLMFNKYDVDNSDSIDKHEARKILFDLGLDFGLEKAEELFNIIDENNTGEINFDHFCNFYMMVKKGDERLTGFGELLEQIKNTPLGVIEAQAKSRNLQVKFITVEEREATATSPPIYIVELHVSGLWYTIENGVAVSKFEVKKYQGLNK